MLWMKAMQHHLTCHKQKNKKTYFFNKARAGIRVLFLLSTVYLKCHFVYTFLKKIIFDTSGTDFFL